MFNVLDQHGIKNCISCTFYLTCNDPKKAATFICNDYETINIAIKKNGVLKKKRSKIPLVESSIESKDDFNIYRTISNVIKSTTILPPDIQTFDQDFAEAPNFYTFCVSDKYLNTRPFIEQALSGTMVFSEYCPNCSDMEWVIDTHKVNDKLSKFEQKVALLEHGKCPYCKATKSKLIKKGLLMPYFEQALCWGQRGGKSALVADQGAYLTHRLIKLQDPNKVYSLKSSSMLHGTFIALTFNQAKDNLWDPYYGNISASPWFQEYHAMLDDCASKHGEELYKFKDTFLSYRHRRFIVYPAGPDKRILRGRTRFMAAMDEVGWFDNEATSKKIRTSATEVYTALQNSLATVRGEAEKLLRQGFNNIPTGYFLNISSPSSVRDKIMELVRKAKGSRVIYGNTKATWEVNPKLPFKSEVIQEQFRSDPVSAMRDFGAQPPLVSNPFIGSQSVVENCLTGKRNPIKITYARSKSPDGSISRYAYVNKLKFGGKPSVLAIDAGFVNNSFACCAAHLEDKFPVIDLLVEIQPLPGVRLNFTKIFHEIISSILDQRNIVLLAADRWQSVKILSDAEEEHGIVTRQYSLKYQDLHVFKSYMEDEQIVLPKPEWPFNQIFEYTHSDYPNCFRHNPVEHFILQCLTVQDTGSGVIKGDNLTDDLFRAAALANTMLLDEKNEELFNKQEEVRLVVDISKYAVLKTGSGGKRLSSTPSGVVNTIGTIKTRREG